MNNQRQFKFVLLLLLPIFLLFYSSCRKNPVPMQAESYTLPPQADISSTPVFSENIQEPAPQYDEYTINISVDPSARKAQVIEKIRFNNETGYPLDRIYLNFFLDALTEDSSDKPWMPYQVNKIFPYEPSYAQVQINGITMYQENLTYDLNDTVLTIYFPEELSGGATAEIVITFEAVLPLMHHRTGADEKGMWFGNFLPLVAVYDDYGWHRGVNYPLGSPFYSNMAYFDVTIHVPEGYTIVSTGIENLKTAENKTTASISRKLSRDFTFYVSRDLEMSHITTRSGVEIRLFTRSGTDIPTEDFLETAAEALEYYSSKIGRYPYVQLDLVECSLYDEMLIAYPEIIFVDSAYMHSEGVLSSLVYEIGHQWFYNIVGINRIREPWMAEGLVAYLREDFLRPDRSELQLAMMGSYQWLENHYPELSGRILTLGLNAYTEGLSYYGIQYIRAKLLFYALDLEMGQDGFQELLRRIYSQYSFQNMYSSDLIALAEEIHGEDLSDFFRSWMLDYTLPDFP